MRRPLAQQTVDVRGERRARVIGVLALLLGAPFALTWVLTRADVPERAEVAPASRPAALSTPSAGGTVHATLTRERVPSQARPSAVASVQLSGRVVGERGEPLRARVCLDLGSGGGGDLYTPSSGAYRCSVAPGQHRVTAFASGRLSDHVEFCVPCGMAEFAAPPLVLARGETVSGRVVDARGDPAPAVLVCVDAERVWTDADGRFALAGLEPGEHLVQVVPGDTLRAEPEHLRVVAPSALPVAFRVLPRGLARGVVRDAQSGAFVTRFLVNDTEVRSLNGSFEVAVNPERDVRVAARGYQTWGSDEPGRSRPGDALDVRLDPEPATGTLRLAARDENGAPVPAFAAIWWSIQGEWREETSTGELRLERASSRATQYRVEAAGRAAVLVETQVPPGGERRVDVVLPRAQPVRLEVLEPNGGPARERQITIYDEQRVPPPWRFDSIRPPTDAEGSTAWSYGIALTIEELDGTLTWLKPGRYLLEIRDSGLDPIPFTVRAEVVTEVRVTTRKALW